MKEMKKVNVRLEEAEARREQQEARHREAEARREAEQEQLMLAVREHMQAQQVRFTLSFLTILFAIVSSNIDSYLIRISWIRSCIDRI